MTIRQVLSRAKKILTDHNIEDASLECELLLRHALKIDRVQLYQDLNRELTPQQEASFWQLMERRLKGEPTAYIIGRREFYGLDFYVDPSVLIPRPETELLVEKALELAQNYPVLSIAEVGTGCGAVAISLALKLPKVKIYATDISPAALKVASINCHKHRVVNRICLLQGDMLDPLPEAVDLIIANLPYVSKKELPQVNSVDFEPSVALNGGVDGLDKIRQLCNQTSIKLLPQGYLLLEIGQGQRKAMVIFLKNLFPLSEVEVIPDLSGIDRIISLTLNPAS